MTKEDETPKRHYRSYRARFRLTEDDILLWLSRAIFFVLGVVVGWSVKP